jgi:hypothetical protein
MDRRCESPPLANHISTVMLKYVASLVQKDASANILGEEKHVRLLTRIGERLCEITQRFCLAGRSWIGRYEVLLRDQTSISIETKSPFSVYYGGNVCIARAAFDVGRQIQLQRKLLPID